MSQIGLPETWRFVVKNETGQNLSGGDVRVTAIRTKLDNVGALEFEASQARLFSMTSALADGGFEVGSTQSNIVDKFLGGDFLMEAFASGGASGDITLYFQNSPDDGTTFPTDGAGDIVQVINFVSTEASSTKIDSFEL